MSGNKKYEVVISGFSGMFPECHNSWEFRDKLISKEVLLRSDTERWNPAEHKKPFMTGRVPEVKTFDYTFMGLGYKFARGVDPTLGPMLEKAVEAIFDSGVNPFALKGRNVCVVAAASVSDADMLRDRPSLIKDGNAIMNYARTMSANRLSYYFNFTGPSYNLDSSWVSAIQGLEMAANLVAQGAVDSAVVTACNLTFFNSIEAEYNDLGIFSNNNKCSPFDESADGCLRSEAVVSFFLQRSEDAKRQYCTLLHTEARCLGSRDTSYIHLDNSLATFLRDFYHHCGVDPSQVSYIETFGSGIKAYDAAEVNAMSEVFRRPPGCPPLQIGSVSGNTGNTECPSGFVSLAKAVIAMETGVIPPTINHHSPNPDLRALVDGQLQLVTETSKLDGDYVAVNSLGFSGSVGHLLAKRNGNTKASTSSPVDGLPRLVVLQARNEENALEVVEKISKMPLDVEFISLANDVFKVPITSYLWRAYSVLPGSDGKEAHSVQLHEPVKRPVWFIFSGMGSQWPGMGRDLLHIPVFAKAVQRCDKVLNPLGIDIHHILTSDDPSVFDSVINCFVGIAMVQVGLVDILTTLGISPDGMIGHSAGELGCGYADGGLTAEETVLLSYARGKASQETDVIKGMMAAVGLGYETIKNRLPPSLDVACHNSADNCTLSGPEQDVLQFVEQLKNENIFARAVNAAGIAFHSRYIKDVGKRLIKSMSKILVTPKPRTSRWVSSSVPQSMWHTPDSQMSSASYYNNNLLSPVLFHEACSHLPANAILIEISPHGLLQAILRRSVNQESVNIPLTSRTAESNLNYLLEAVGKLHLHNVEVNVNAIYPPIEYPVSRGTPSLVNLLSWHHKENLFQGFKSVITMILNKGSYERSVEISEIVPDYQLWKEHMIYDQVVVPFSQLLMYTLEIVFAKNRSNEEGMTVVMEDVKYNKLITMSKTEKSVFVSMTPSSKKFQISLEEDDCSGAVFLAGSLKEDTNITFSIPELPRNSSTLKAVHGDYVYYKLEEVGYCLGEVMRSIKDILLDNQECWATVNWTGDMIVFLESLFQIVIYLRAENVELLYQPASFVKLAVNAPYMKSLTSGTEVFVHYNRKTNILACEGVKLLGLVLSPVTNKQSTNLKWTEQIYKLSGEMPLKESSISPENVLEVEDNNWINRLRNVLNNEKIKGTIILVSRNLSPRHIMQTLFRKNYLDRVRAVCILDKGAPQFSLGCSLYRQQLSLGLSLNILSNGRWKSLTNIDLDISMDTKISDCLTLRKADLECQVCCISLNSSISEESLGVIDYSGLKGGERVMGVARLDQGLVLDQTLKWTVPAHWTMEEAATVPAIYSMAYYCSQVLGKVQAGQNVLVTDGFSLIGQAVTLIVLQLGANLIVSVSNEEEKTSFLEVFPKLRADAVLVRQHCDLVPNLKLLLEGQTVHVIFNSLKAKELWACNSLLYGQQQSRFVHLEEIYSGDKDCIGLSAFLYGNSFHGTNINSLSNLNEQIKRQLERAVLSGIHQGVVKPLKRSQATFGNVDSAIRYHKECTVHDKVVIAVDKLKTGNLLSTRINSHEENVILIVGSTSKHFLDLASWVLKQSDYKFVFALTGSRKNGLNLQRLQRKMSLQKVPSYIFFSPRLSTLDGMSDLLKSVSFIGNVSLIICHSMDESSETMRNLDLASRQVLPTLQQFVSLLGKGSEVCESREIAGLPVISIKQDSPDVVVKDVLPFLKTLIIKNEYKAHFFTVRNNNDQNQNNERTLFEGYLPCTLDNLYSLGLEVSDKVQWVECRTLSPGYSHVHHNLLPVFVVSAVGSHTLQPLLANLMHPAFCASPPASIGTTQEHADYLIEELTTIQRKGPYNIIGDWWSGGVVLALANLLEGQGHQVELFLLEDIPTTAQERLTLMCGEGAVDLPSALLAQVFSLSEEDTMMISRHKKWEDKVESVLQKAAVSDHKALQGAITRGLTSLNSQLSALQLMPSASQLFQGNMTLVQMAGASLSKSSHLSKICQKTAKLVVTEATDIEQLISSRATAAAINESCAFDWNC